jgi:hypothetical protein
MRSLSYARVAAAALALVIVAPAFAADPPADKEATGNEETGGDDPAKFFLFHLDGVGFETAKADYSYCIDQSKGILSLRDKMPSGGGLLGALINGRMAQIDRFRMRNAAMRKCMGLLGYARYHYPQDEWKILVKEGDIVVDNHNKVDPEVVDRLARYASGPTPTTKRLEP